jgi:hypothetical protein
MICFQQEVPTCQQHIKRDNKSRHIVQASYHHLHRQHEAQCRPSWFDEREREYLEEQESEMYRVIKV